MVSSERVDSDVDDAWLLLLLLLLPLLPSLVMDALLMAAALCVLLLAGA
jgi:hypothetical protein